MVKLKILFVHTCKEILNKYWSFVGSRSYLKMKAQNRQILTLGIFLKKSRDSLAQEVFLS